MKGKVNMDLKFPIIEIYGKQVDVYASVDAFSTVNKESINFYTNTKTMIIDLSGILYSREEIIPLKYTNLFWGFQLPWGFGNYYANVILKKEKDLNLIELREIVMTVIVKKKAEIKNSDINISKLKHDLLKAELKEEIIFFLLKLIDPNHIHW